MPNLDIVVELIIEIGRTFLIGELSERIRRARMTGKLHGMAGVRRHVHLATRRRLLNKLLTRLRDQG